MLRVAIAATQIGGVEKISKKRQENRKDSPFYGGVALMAVWQRRLRQCLLGFPPVT